jgi:hypothetical protein
VETQSEDNTEVQLSPVVCHVSQSLSLLQRFNIDTVDMRKRTALLVSLLLLRCTGYTTYKQPKQLLDSI